MKSSRSSSAKARTTGKIKSKGATFLVMRNWMIFGGCVTLYVINFSFECFTNKMSKILLALMSLMTLMQEQSYLVTITLHNL